MVDPISLTNNALTLVGRVSDLVKKGATIELQGVIIALKEAIIGLKEENLELKTKLIELQKSIAIKTELVFEDPVYFRILDSGKREGPYCAACYGQDEKLTLLPTIEAECWKCNVCKENFETQSHRQRRRQPVQTRAIVSRGPNSWMR